MPSVTAAPSSAARRAYPIGEIVGVGGMGVVYATRDVEVAVPLVIKVLRPELAGEPTVRARFAAEIRAVRRLDHPNLVRYVDAGENFLVMERAPGAPLGTMIADSGPVSLVRAVEITNQLLRALSHAHARGVIHADVKSDNLLVETTAAGDHITLIDFGVSRILDDSIPIDDASVSGTPEYMAPEVIQGQPPTVAADLYAVGVILYELLTGTTPCGGGSADAILARHLDDDIVPPSLRCPDRAVPPALERLIMCALAKDPAQRFKSVGTFAVALREAASGIQAGANLAAATVSRPALSAEMPTRNWSSVHLPQRVRRRRRGTGAARPTR